MDDRTHAMRRRRRRRHRLLLRRKTSRRRARCRNRGPVGLTAAAKLLTKSQLLTEDCTSRLPWQPRQLGRKDPDPMEPRRTLAKKMWIGF